WIVPHVISGKQSDAEVGILVRECGPVRISFVEPAECLEHRAANGKLPGPDVEQGQRATASLEPGLVAVGQESGGGSGVTQGVAHDRMRTGTMETPMLGNHVRSAEHVIVEKQQDVVARLGCAAVPRMRGSMIGLLDDLDRKRGVDLREAFRRTVGRSVDNADQFELAPVSRAVNRANRRRY